MQTYQRQAALIWEMKMKPLSAQIQWPQLTIQQIRCQLLSVKWTET